MDAYAPRVPAPLRLLVVTRSYPAPDDLYQYPFVHRRVLAYRAAGHPVAVFRPSSSEAKSHSYEGVACRSGNASSLRKLVGEFRPDVIAVHGLSEAMWPWLEQLDSIPMLAWLHGSEIPAFFQRKGAPIEAVEGRSEFWRTLLEYNKGSMKLVFPSHGAVQLMRETCPLRSDDYAVLPNPIDTHLFAYRPKSAPDRFRILSIRPYDSPTYANDLAVSAVLSLASSTDFERLRFTFIGDGPMFEETLAPIAGLANVAIRRGFLSQSEIAREHMRHGIFLVPTRLDTHGVSRDEAMASGLVAVTNVLPVVEEFVDDDCAALAAPDDGAALAGEVSRMIEEPELFLHRSAAAAERVRRERGHQIVIPRELGLLSCAVHG